MHPLLTPTVAVRSQSRPRATALSLEIIVDGPGTDRNRETDHHRRRVRLGTIIQVDQLGTDLGVQNVLAASQCLGIGATARTVLFLVPDEASPAVGHFPGQDVAQSINETRTIPEDGSNGHPIKIAGRGNGIESEIGNTRGVFHQWRGSRRGSDRLLA